MGIGDKLQELLDNRRRNVNDLSKSTGIPASTIYSIIRRNNTKVDLSDLQTIADELCVTLDYFSDSPSKSPVGDDELTEYLDELHKRPEMKMLFKVATKATKEDVEKAVKIIEMLKGNGSDDI